MFGHSRCLDNRGSDKLRSTVRGICELSKVMLCSFLVSTCPMWWSYHLDSEVAYDGSCVVDSTLNCWCPHFVNNMVVFLALLYQLLKQFLGLHIYCFLPLYLVFGWVSSWLFWPVWLHLLWHGFNRSISLLGIFYCPCPECSTLNLKLYYLNGPVHGQWSLFALLLE